jgi:hypothetical protein
MYHAVQRNPSASSLLVCTQEQRQSLGFFFGTNPAAGDPALKVGVLMVCRDTDH